jgi:predicted DNA-binding protein
MADDCMVRVPRHLFEEIRRLAHPATAAAYLRHVIEQHIEQARKK